MCVHIHTHRHAHLSELINWLIKVVGYKINTQSWAVVILETSNPKMKLRENFM